MKKRWHIINSITFVSASILLLLLSFWSLYPYPTPTIKEPIQILNQNKKIAIGDRIVMKLEVTKPADYSPKGSVFITCNDGNLVTLAPLTTNLPVGSYTILNDKYTLPPKVAVGSECKFNFRNEYQVNPIRTVTGDWASETFKVKE